MAPIAKHVFNVDLRLTWQHASRAGKFRRGGNLLGAKSLEGLLAKLTGKETPWSLLIVTGRPIWDVFPIENGMNVGSDGYR